MLLNPCARAPPYALLLMPHMVPPMQEAVDVNALPRPVGDYQVRLFKDLEQALRGS